MKKKNKKNPQGFIWRNNTTKQMSTRFSNQIFCRVKVLLQFKDLKKILKRYVVEKRIK